MNKLPRARNTDLVLQESDKELLLYDLNIHKAFCLNETATLVYQNCDGKTTFDELIKQTNLTEDLILLTLDGLQKENLLQDKIETGIPKDRLSRRKMLLTAGAAAMALPLITALVSPTAAQAAQSACINNGFTASASSTAAQGSTQCQSNATNRCCSKSSSNFSVTTNQDGSFTCTVTCGFVIG